MPSTIPRIIRQRDPPRLHAPVELSALLAAWPVHCMHAPSRVSTDAAAAPSVFTWQSAPLPPPPATFVVGGGGGSGLPSSERFAKLDYLKVFVNLLVIFKHGTFAFPQPPWDLRSRWLKNGLNLFCEPFIMQASLAFRPDDMTFLGRISTWARKQQRNGRGNRRGNQRRVAEKSW